MAAKEVTDLFDDLFHWGCFSEQQDRAGVWIMQGEKSKVWACIFTGMADVDQVKIRYFQKKLLAWYKTDGRRFYWRRKGLSNYQYVIAEVLLQRTKAETIAKFYPSFIQEFPNWKSLAEADVNRISEFLKPIGLYTQRSVRLKNLAVEMVKRNGRLPKDRTELESIPFMGQYIANAVELVIFDRPSPLVDVNMSRVLERFFGPRKLADIRYDPYLQELSRRVVNHVDTKEMNWAILDFAALICKASRPNHENCPLKTHCNYYLNKCTDT
jgi:A/G-specific adenine glycosylase